MAVSTEYEIHKYLYSPFFYFNNRCHKLIDNLVLLHTDVKLLIFNRKWGCNVGKSSKIMACCFWTENKDRSFWPNLFFISHWNGWFYGPYWSKTCSLSWLKVLQYVITLCGRTEALFLYSIEDFWDLHFAMTCFIERFSLFVFTSLCLCSITR